MNNYPYRPQAHDLTAKEKVNASLTLAESDCNADSAYGKAVGRGGELAAGDLGVVVSHVGPVRMPLG